MYDITLYGHLTFDRIFDGFTKDNSVGSMGNVWYHLNNINPSLKINLEPTDIGEALILVNKEKAERASVANLSMKQRQPSIAKSRWSHILYLNELSDTSFVKNIGEGIVSADLCRGKKLTDLDILQEIDFLFISDEDLFMDINKLYPCVRQAVILHHSGGSTCYTPSGGKIVTEVDILENINVLGCGDMLASYFINEYLKTNDLEKSIKLAHNLASYRLEEKSEEI
jgi:sugar/nucleoside kinase (ribokinase family)